MAARRVAIVGGGPAGCSAALRCGVLGVPAVLFEARERHAGKTCGDALIHSAVAHVARFGIGPGRLRELRGRPFEAFGIARLGSSEPPGRFPAPGGWLVRRAVLDQALRDAVEPLCEVRHGAAVTGVSPGGGGWSLRVGPAERQECFDAVILATGAAAHLSAALGLAGAPGRGVGLRGYLQDEVRRGDLLFEMTHAPTIGYRWTFPMAQGANVGACRLGHGPGDTPRGVAIALRALLAPFRLAGLAGGVIPTWSGEGRLWHHPAGAASCGDCAGLVNPTTGEGITAALVSGDLAASAIVGYLNGDRRALEAYSEGIWNVFHDAYTGCGNSIRDAAAGFA